MSILGIHSSISSCEVSIVWLASLSAIEVRDDPETLMMDRRNAIRFGVSSILGASTLLGGSRLLRAASQGGASGRAEWMSGRWGIMVHWIAPGPAPEVGNRVRELEIAVNNFKLSRFIDDLRECGASWVIFTLGQNTGVYVGRNEYLEERGFGQLQSGRDLVLELAEAVKAEGRRFIAYLPAEVGNSRKVQTLFSWDEPGKQEFEKAYLSFVKSYSDHLGRNCDGWWFDGCYDSKVYPWSFRNWHDWAAAARSGNPDRVLAFNDGSFLSRKIAPTCSEQDFLAGECGRIIDGRAAFGRNSGEFFQPNQAMVANTGCLYHVLTPIDCNGKWGHETPGPMSPPTYEDDQLFVFVRNWLQVGAAVTLNVGIYQEGHLASSTVSQLGRLKAAM